MNLTGLLCRVVLIASGCTSIWAQTAPVVPNPVVPDPVAPKPFQFNPSQYKGLLPGWPVILKPGSPVIVAHQILLSGRPCAAVRIMKPNPALDPGMIPRNPGRTPMPIEAHSRDITEMNVPAPSCADIAAPQPLNAGPEKR
jgi:hypothetical protein